MSSEKVLVLRHIFTSLYSNNFMKRPYAVLVFQILQFPINQIISRLFFSKDIVCIKT